MEEDLMANLTSKERSEVREAVQLLGEGYIDELSDDSRIPAGLKALISGSVKLGLHKPGELERNLGLY